MSSITKKLNSPQKNAVENTDGPLLILAGAGTGKTRTMTHRIAYLIEQKKVDPADILAVTFTNKAANEMQERVQRLIHSNVEPNISTFHKWGVNFLRSNNLETERDLSFSIYDTKDQKKIIKEIIEQDNNLEIGGDFSPKDLVAKISRLKDDLKEPGDSDIDNWISRFYEEYEKRLATNNAYDFGDLIMKPVNLLRNNNNLRNTWVNNYEYIMVDEFQDTNYAQYELIWELSSSPKDNIAVVGDDDQGIYSWRGADINNILHRFEDDYNNVNVVKLERNYRSRPEIIKKANKLIKNNEQRQEKEMKPDKNKGGTVKFSQHTDDKAEARFILQEVKTLQEQYTLEDMAVLLRTNAQTRPIEQVFMRRGIPYTVIGNTRFIDRKEIRDLISYLEIMVNPSDRSSFDRAVNCPSRKIGEKTREKLYDYCDEQDVNPIEGIDTIIDDQLFTGRMRTAFMRFKNIYNELEQKKKSGPEAVLNTLLRKTNYKEDELEKRYDQDSVKERMENIDQLLNMASDFETVQDFMQEAKLMTSADEEGRNGVNILTLHAAKGLEFATVFLSGVEKEILPHQNSLYNEGGVEEERRLCYVGMTRAEERLYITMAKQRRQYGKIKNQSPSRFLAEAGLINNKQKTVRSKQRSRPKRTKKKNKSSNAVNNKSNKKSNTNNDNNDNIDIDKLKDAETIKHPNFGEGEIIEVDDIGTMTMLRIKFKNGSTKQLAAEHASLTIAE